MDLRSTFVACVCLSWKWLKKHRYLWSDYHIIQSYINMSCKWCINTINPSLWVWVDDHLMQVYLEMPLPRTVTLGSVCLRLNVGSGPLHQHCKVKVYKKLTTKKVMSSWWWHWFWGEPQLYNEDSPTKRYYACHHEGLARRHRCVVVAWDDQSSATFLCGQRSLAQVGPAKKMLLGLLH